MHYIYYRIVKFYKVVIRESNPDLYAFFALTVIQSFYVFGLLNMLFDYIGKSNKILSLLEMAGVFIVFLLANLVGLNRKKNLGELELVWEKETEMLRRFKGGLVLLFVLMGPILLGVSVVWF